MTSYAGAARTGAAAKHNSISAADGLNRKRLYKTVAAALFAIFVMVGLQAYTATLQHANNVLADNNAVLQAEIDSIEAEIIEETKVTRIEKTATKKYGMVYPSSDNCITIYEEDGIAENLAATIRNEAYN